MKRTNLQQRKPWTANAIPAGLALAVAVGFLHQDASAAVLAVNLGTASNFAVLAGTGITIAGPINSTTITGNIGSFATTSVTGLENVVLNGVNHAGDAVTQQGKLDLSLAYTDAAGRTPTFTFPAISDLGGLTLAGGVYKGLSSLGITGTLTLDAGGNPDAFWIFQTGSTLTTASSSMVLLTGGAQASNVIWQVTSSATLGTNSRFVGSILASDSIALTTGATLTGRALAKVGEVTLDHNTILVPETSSALLLGAGLVTLLARRRRVPC